MVALAAPNQDQPDNDLQLYRVKDAMRLFKMSRTVIYEQLRTGRLRSSSRAGCA
jgi:hypothetical protein